MDRVRFAHATGQKPFDFNITFAGRKVTAVMGASGSGKSTLLNLLAGFAPVDTGRLLIGTSDITDVHPSKRPISMIFQDHNVFAHLSVEQNVGLGISPSLSYGADGPERIATALHDVGLGGYGHRMPSTLSGGERQRVALARMLVRNQPVLLLDEALASLGPGMRKSILGLIKDLDVRENLTVIMTTHDPVDAEMIADDVVFIADRTVAVSGSTQDVVTNPRDARVQAYLGV
ncbi:MAG: ATP-binding cassette domain-containing protein [Pseudomonadota bacterium]